MIRSLPAPLGAGVLLMILGAASAIPSGAQTVASGQDVGLKLGGRLHSQFASSSAKDGRSLDLFIRRARFKADLDLSDVLSGRIQVDFSGSSVSLKDAYARLEFGPAFALDMGQFKRAFDLFELASSTELELVERDGRIDGLDVCPGVGGVCSFSGLTEKLSYSERDVGVRLHGSGRGGVFDYMVTVTNGAGANTSDENDAKSVAARITVEAARGVRLGANVSVHDYVGPDDDDRYARAFGGDVSFGAYRSGLHLRAALLAGENWKLLDDSGDPRTFVTGQALLSYYHALDGSPFLEGLEPVGRVSWGDPDRAEDDNAGLLLTPGLFAYLRGRNRIGANLDIYVPQDGDREASFKVMWFVYF